MLIYGLMFSNIIFVKHRKDRLRLWDGDYRSPRNRLAWPGFCGSTIPDDYISPGNVMSIRFANRGQNPKTGFEIRIEQGT